MKFFARSLRSSIFVAPFRKTVVPRSEWISVTDNNLDFDPLLHVPRDISLCVWAQRLKADMHPDGPPFPVFHSHEVRRSLEGGVQVGPHAILFGRQERSSNIWLLEPAKHGSP
jgi:hypothetical protein